MPEPPAHTKLDVVIRTDAEGDFREGSWRIACWVGCQEHKAVIALLVKAGDEPDVPLSCAVSSAHDLLTMLRDAGVE